MRERVLVVDDDADALKTYTDILESEGYEVSAAASGEQALERIDRTRPDLILLDIMMPDKTGIEVARELTQRRDTRDIPIVMITAVSAFPVGAGLAGIDGIRPFLYKPCPTSQLLAGIRDAPRANV